MKLPKDCSKHEDLADLTRDNLDTGGYWILHSGDHVTLTAQEVGQPSTASIRIPVEDFNTMMRWYWEGDAPPHSEKD